MAPTDLACKRWLDLAAITSLHAVLVWAPLAAGAYRGWPLAIAQILTVFALACWVLGMTGERRLEWRRTALDLPLGLLAALVLIQLALGAGPLVTWAVGPAATDLAAPAMPTLVLVGTVSPSQTARSFRLFLTYAAVYVLVVNLVRTRLGLDRLLRMLLLVGGAASFLALLDYLAGRAWLLGWGEPAARPRLSGAFVNPDHFAAWLEMLICLGIGYVLARSRPPEDARAAWSSRRAREQLIRRSLPMIAIAVMALALVFTLSRGGVVSIAVALAALLALQGFAGRVRSSLVLVGLLLALTAGYGAWIGLEPLLERFRSDLYSSRLLQLRSSLGMLGSFPVFGVGLGAYRDIYFRYQPPELSPGKMYFPFAHNDLLQLAVELGLVGTAVCLFAAWRVAADLIGAHLLGRGRCPVGGGERDGARRGEAWSVGVGLGAVTAVLALCVHSAFDFGARIPANGFLAAACLGIATVALHTRFAGAGGRLLTAVRVLPLGGGRLRPAIVRVACVVLALACLPAIVRTPLVDSSLEATGVPASVRVERALALAPADAEARWARARLRVASARRIWESGQTEDGRVPATWAERRREALPLFDGAVLDLTAALRARPSDPFLHDALGWAHADAAAIDEVPPAARQGAAVTALRRAIALQPDNPYLYRSLAALALGQREPLLPIALGAARSAIARDPSLLPDLAGRFTPLGLVDAQWAQVVPDTADDRLELGALLDEAGLGSAAEAQYRRAVALAAPGTEALARHALSRSLARRGDTAGALAELDIALRLDPANPELHLARGNVLAARRDPAALDAIRAALGSAEARAATAHVDAARFGNASPRARALAERALGRGEPGVLRYRRALAELLIERRLWLQAAAEWEAVIAVAPRDARAHFLLAAALDALGRPAEALDHSRRAVILDGAATPYRMALGARLWDSEQYYQAINEWRAVVVADPGSLEARLALGRAYQKTGERGLAVREYQRVLEIAPNNEEARRALGRLSSAR